MPPASNQPPAPPHQNQRDQSPAPLVGNTEQAEQPIEQEVSVAIVTPGDSTITLSRQERADYEERRRLALHEPLPVPDSDSDDFAHLLPSTPYDPETATPYDWSKREAWIQEKDSEGKGRLRRILIVFLLLTLDRTNSTRMVQSNSRVC